MEVVIYMLKNLPGTQHKFSGQAYPIETDWMWPCPVHYGCWSFPTYLAKREETSTNFFLFFFLLLNHIDSQVTLTCPALNNLEKQTPKKFYSVWN